MILPKRAQSTGAVAAHYNELDVFYRDIWGEHVHHGYWASGRENAAEAAEALVTLLADQLMLAPGQQVCDIGCGYGATARLLASSHGVQVTGVTVSAAQADIAEDHPQASDSVSIQLQDWLDNRFPDASFDRAYAIESSEHMADQRRFFQEAFRVLRPGGRLAICAWLAGDTPQPWQVRHLLEPICREGRLPGLGNLADYQLLAEQAGFRVLRIQDLSTRVSRTWSICIRRLIGRLLTRPGYLRFLLNGQAASRIFAVTMVRILIAYRTRSMRYGLLLFERN